MTLGWTARQQILDKPKKKKKKKRISVFRSAMMPAHRQFSQGPDSREEVYNFLLVFVCLFVFCGFFCCCLFGFFGFVFVFFCLSSRRHSNGDVKK